MHILLQSSSIQTSFGGGHHHQGRQHHRPKIPLLESVYIAMHTSLCFVSPLQHRAVYGTPPTTYVARQHFTYWLTPWNRVLLEKLTGPQLVKEKKSPPTFYGKAIWNARHLTLTCARSIQSMSSPTHFLKVYFNIIPPTHACILQVVSVPQVSSPKPCMHLFSPHTCYMPRPSHSSRFDHPRSTDH